jgi:hypothetical protein
MSSVPGWFYPLDFLAFVNVDRIQREAGYFGDVLEIGTYYGKSAILLGFLTARSEIFYACDAFMRDESLLDDNRAENQNNYDGFTQADFEYHYLRFHDRLPRVFAMASSEIDVTRLEGTCRLVHLDGSHTYEVLRSDIRMAERVMGPGGVAVFDDVCRAYLPGAALAIWEAVLSHEFAPICLTRSKLYGTWDMEAVWLADALAEWVDSDPRLGVELHALAGWKVPRIFPLKPLRRVS